MSLSTHAVFRQMPAALAGVLGKAEAFAVECKIEPAALLQARLSPDMFPLARQVQSTGGSAGRVSARLAGVGVPAHEGVAA
jgi:hypothetical protein